MKRAAMFLALALSVSSCPVGAETNTEDRIQRDIAEMKRYRDELRKAGLHEYADRISFGKVDPTLIEQAYMVMKFEQFLIENWGSREKIDEYLRAQGNSSTQTYWLLQLRLAQHHWMRGEKTEVSAIVDAFASHLRDSVVKKDEDREIKAPGAHDPATEPAEIDPTVTK